MYEIKKRMQQIKHIIKHLLHSNIERGELQQFSQWEQQE